MFGAASQRRAARRSAALVAISAVMLSLAPAASAQDDPATPAATSTSTEAPTASAQDDPASQDPTPAPAPAPAPAPSSTQAPAPAPDAEAPAEDVEEPGGGDVLRSTVSVIYDGTGHPTPENPSTSNWTFYNERNGFPNGDNTPNDLKVADRGEVGFGYNITVPARDHERTISVQAYVRTDDGAPSQKTKDICIPDAVVAAVYDARSDSCVFTVPPNSATLSINRTASARAYYSQGSEMRSNLIVFDGAGDRTESVSDTVKIVGTSVTDFRMRKACHEAGSWFSKPGVQTLNGKGTFCWEHGTEYYVGYDNDAGKDAGYPEGRSITLDVSGFPDGTEFFVGETPVPVEGGSLTVSWGENQEPITSVNFQVPMNSGPDTSTAIRVGAPVVNYVNKYVHGEGAGTNYDTGFEMGSGEPENFVTAPKGELANNNNWANLQWVETEGAKLGTVSKEVYGPKSNVGTEALPESREWIGSPDTRGKTQIRDHRGWPNDGRYLRDSLEFYSYVSARSVPLWQARDTGEPMVAAVCDVWDPVEFKFDSARSISASAGSPVEQGNKPLEVHEVLYSDTPMVNGAVGGEWPSVRESDCGDTSDPAVWSTERPADSDITGVVVKFVIPDSYGNSTDPGRDSVAVSVAIPHKMHDTYDNHVVDGSVIPNWYSFIPPMGGTDFPDTRVRGMMYSAEPPRPATYIGARILESSTHPGGVVTIKLSEGSNKSLLANEIANADTSAGPISPYIELTGDRCLTDYELANPHADRWYMEVIGGEDAVCGDTTTPAPIIRLIPRDEGVFTYVDSGHPGLSHGDIAAFPTLHATTSLSAAVTTNTSVGVNAVLSYEEAPEDTTLMRGSASASLKRAATSGMLKTVSKEKVETGDGFYWDLEAVNSADSSLGDLRVVDVLPEDGASTDYSGHTYASRFGGILRVSRIEARPGSSSSMRIEYTDTPRGEIDPNDPADPLIEWHPVGDSVDDLSSATALRITVPDFGARGSEYAGVRVWVSAPDSEVGDVFVNRLGEGVLSSGGLPIPAPAPVVTRVVDADLSGTFWWDQDRNYAIGPDEERIAGIEVTLRRTDDGAGPAEREWTTTTAANGFYEFRGLHSGTYVLEFDRGNGPEEVPLVVDGTDLSVDQTRGHMLYNPTPEEGRVANLRIAVGDSVKDVNFGFVRPALPEIDVVKKINGHDANTAFTAALLGAGEETMEVSVEAINTGTTPLTAVHVTDDVPEIDELLANATCTVHNATGAVTAQSTANGSVDLVPGGKAVCTVEAVSPAIGEMHKDTVTVRGMYGTTHVSADDPAHAFRLPLPGINLPNTGQVGLVSIILLALSGAAGAYWLRKRGEV